MQKQFGRSMVEMLGVLAIIGVLSIGGILGYRRAVNNHQANTILDDVNRFAFVILERSGLAVAENIDRGDFVESGTYKLTGFQGEDAGQFSITVKNVPKGVCEPLLAKAIVEYKVGIVAAGGSRDDEVLYDTLNTDLCQENNDMSFYFGDTSGICNAPDESGYTPCTQNSDCCGGFFCWYPNNSDCYEAGMGRCEEITSTNFPPQTTKMSDGKTWTYSPNMNWWSAKNWCEAQGLKMVKLADIGCTNGINCHSSTADAIGDKWASSVGHLWLEGVVVNCYADRFSPWYNNWIDAAKRYIQGFGRAFCH